MVVPRPDEVLEVYFQQGPMSDSHKGFGPVVGQRAESGAQSSGEKKRFHGCRFFFSRDNVEKRLKLFDFFEIIWRGNLFFVTLHLDFFRCVCGG
jgi:hypothetical protein